jgi:tetratricopeptide (TPR) repeat protein
MRAPSHSGSAPLSALALAAIAAFVALAIVTAWLPGATAPYQFDDFNTPVGDPASQSLDAFGRALPHTLRPLTKLSFALESSLGADSAPARRALNFALFLGCALGVGALARAAGLPRAWAAALACLWAVHPVHAELLIALAGRPVLLSLCLSLASAWLLLERKPKSALALALLAVLARETALLWLVACAASCARAYAVSRARVALAAAAAGLCAGGLLLASPGLRLLLHDTWTRTAAVDRLGLQWAALPHGLWLLLFEPSAFNLDMEFAPHGGARLVLIVAALSVYIFGAWLVFGRGRPSAVRVLALLWLCLMLPSHSLVPKQDVLTARPFAAAFAPLCVLLGLAVAALSHERRLRSSVPLALTAWALALIPLTRARAALYQDPLALWQDAAQHSRHALRPLLNLATLQAQRGQLDDARATLQRALARDPASHDVQSSLQTVDILIARRSTATIPNVPRGAVP